jgi:malonyl-CoA O-methyltransferase
MPLSVQVNGRKGAVMSFKKSVRTSNFQGYNRWSTFYDQYPNPTVAIDEISFPRLWQHVRGMDVLEIGCGTGRHTQKLVGAGNRVLAVDLSPGMLAIAKEKLRGQPVEFIEGDFLTRDSIDNQQYDVAISSLVIEHISELDRFFEKVVEALKEHGEFFLSEIHPLRASKGILAHFRDNHSGIEIQLDSHPHAQESIESSAKGAGFQIVSRNDILGNEDLTEIHGKWIKYLNVPMIQTWRLRKL